MQISFEVYDQYDQQLLTSIISDALAQAYESVKKYSALNLPKNRSGYILYINVINNKDYEILGQFGSDFSMTTNEFISRVICEYDWLKRSTSIDEFLNIDPKELMKYPGYRSRLAIAYDEALSKLNIEHKSIKLPS